MVRVIAMNDQGRTHLNILRRIATSPSALFFENFTLPMLHEVHFEDVVFGVFPLVGPNIEDAHYDSPFRPNENSVGDLLNMYLQALQVRMSS